MAEIPGFVTPEFCRETIHQAEAIGFRPATITTKKGEVLRTDIRDNDRVILDDGNRADLLRNRLRGIGTDLAGLHYAVGVNTRFRLHRYQDGQKFDWHQHGAYHAPEGPISRFTFMIYLNDSFQGGATSFAGMFWHQTFPDFAITAETGKALLFRHPISHRGDQITAGRKYVLRPDVMFPSMPN